jgi:hypothetical protein
MTLMQAITEWRKDPDNFDLRVTEGGLGFEDMYEEVILATPPSQIVLTIKHLVTKLCYDEGDFITGTTLMSILSSIAAVLQEQEDRKPRRAEQVKLKGV